MMLGVFILTFIFGGALCSGDQWEYIIVGAGPAGLQMAYFLEKAGRAYIVLEKSHTAGAFFTVYPRHDRLISINKRHTGQSNKEFNLRHDWNSLLSDDPTLLFKHYSKEFFPHRLKYVDYLQDFAMKHKLNVQYDTEVQDIQQYYNATSAAHISMMKDQNGNNYQCRYLLLATGMATPNTVDLHGDDVSEGYESFNADPTAYEGKSVLILGNGNSAFETADSIYPYAGVVHILGRSRVRLAWETHYVGDLRAVNNNMLDTYQLKSLDGVLEGKLHHLNFSRLEDGTIKLSLRNDDAMMDNFAMRDRYHSVIRCLGFKFDTSIFNETFPFRRCGGKLQKYLFVESDYQLAAIPNVYLMGTAAHSVDFRRSAGGFIHGFRYVVRALHRILEKRNHEVKWPSTSLRASDLLTFVIKRLNEVSGTYQMYGVLADVVIMHENELRYINEFPIGKLPEIAEMTGYPVSRLIVINLEYGKHFTAEHHDVFRKNRATAFANRAHKSNFLHPVLYYYDQVPTGAEMRSVHPRLPRPSRLHHIVEDFLTQWTAPTAHVLPLRRFLEACVGRDERRMFAEHCFHLALTHARVPADCEENYLVDRGLTTLTVTDTSLSGARLHAVM